CAWMPGLHRAAAGRSRAASASLAIVATASPSRAAPARMPVPSSTGAAAAGGAPPEPGSGFAHQAEPDVVVTASGLPGAGRRIPPAAPADRAGFAVALAIQQPLRQRGGTRGG